MQMLSGPAMKVKAVFCLRPPYGSLHLWSYNVCGRGRGSVTTDMRSWIVTKWLMGFSLEVGPFAIKGPAVWWMAEAETPVPFAQVMSDAFEAALKSVCQLIWSFRRATILHLCSQDEGRLWGPGLGRMGLSSCAGFMYSSVLSVDL